MSKTSQSKAKKLNELILDLQTLESTKFSSAIEGLKTFGNHTVIPVLAELYPKCDTDQKHQIVNLLIDVRDEESQDALMEVLMDLQDQETRIAFLSTVWNSSMDYSEYLVEFIKIVVKGDFMEAIECHTIIDNLEGPFDEDIVMEAQMILKENLETLMKDEQKRLLINDILLKLNDFDQSVES